MFLDVYFFRSFRCLFNLWNINAVIWGYKSVDVASAAREDITAVKNELLCSQTKRWQAVGMLKHIFSCVNLPWDLKQQAVDFLLSIMDGNMPLKSPDENVDCSIYIPSMYAALQVDPCEPHSYRVQFSFYLFTDCQNK